MNKLSHASLEQAANWYVQLHDEQVAEPERLRWQAWLAQSPEHQAAWRYVERVGQRFAPLQNESEAVSHALRNSARTSISRRQSLKGLLILAATGLAGWAVGRNTPLLDSVERLSADLSTGTGETREATLSDGSRIWLNALSALECAFRCPSALAAITRRRSADRHRERSWSSLLGRDRTGPDACAGDAFQRAQNDRNTVLNVYEGAVEATTAKAKAKWSRAVSKWLFSTGRFHTPTAADPSREAWRRGLLLADNLPLGELIEELSRYRPGHLHCDPAVAALPVMGSFPLKDTDQALRLLEAALPIRVDKTFNWWVSVGPKA
jgi:ferric-dicitrate binding protein FerR (iron transport regulator)